MLPSLPARRPSVPPLRHHTALVWAFAIDCLVLGLFCYWFAIADRYVIFLYNHSTTGIPPAQPFDELTRSRYWMAGLVAAGAVLVGCTGINWLLGRLAAWQGRRYTPPPWWLIWGWGAPALAVGIPAHQR